MKKILLVDDDRLFLKSMSRTLTAENYQVEQATSGQEALEKIKVQTYDLVILDYKMQPIDGMQVLKAIHEKKLNCAVIMITAYGTFDMATEALAHNAVTILPKPVEMQRLKTVVKSALRGPVFRYQAKGAAQKLDRDKLNAARQSAKVKTATSPSESGDNILIVDDSKLFRKMIISTVSSAFEDFSFIEAENGVEAIERLNKYPTKLIILDINMPHMNGIEFMKLKRKSTRFKNIPIIVLTTEKEKETMGKAYLSGATVFMKKPFQRQELIKVVKTMNFWHIKK